MNGNIGVVAIGRNEGARLQACLESIEDVPVVYVDSGSTDGSCDLARRLGAQCVELDMTVPFTAARARNAGFEQLLAAFPDLTFVMFVDGDCILDPKWLAAATSFLDDHPKVGVVCGRRRERFPDATLYNLLCDIEWDTPVGSAVACGGDAVYRVEVFREAKGFDSTFIAGEEPELCFRIRAAGWVVERINADMTYHDAAMTQFRQWWKRAERSGYAYWLNAYKHGGSSAERFRVKAVANILFWGLLIVAAFLSLLFVREWWWLALLAGGVLFQYLRLLNKYHRLKRDFGRRAWFAYPGFILIGKLPQFKGLLAGVFRTGFAVPHVLVEYK